MHSLNSGNSTSGSRSDFAQAIREFTEVLKELRAEDLTEADRAALRALLNELQGHTPPK